LSDDLVTDSLFAAINAGADIVVKTPFSDVREA